MQKHLQREKQTILHMIAIYCRTTHGCTSICFECSDLLRYSMERIEACTFTGSTKPPCGLCPSNCFSAAMQRDLSRVMRFSGPRMVYRHPVLALLHLRDALRWKMQKRRGT